jgi:hypothetical protein
MMKAAAILNTGALIRRGRNLVVVRSAGIDLSRVRAGECPLLDTHSSPLGHLPAAWLSDIDDDLLMAELVFDNSRAGRIAFEMLERLELTNISCGLRTIEISIHDRDGVALDDDDALARQDDPDLVFCVQRSILQEVSLCSVPVDPGAIVRASSETGVYREMIRQGEETLQRLLHPEHDQDHGRPLLRTIMPGRETILHGAPERIR